MPGNVADAAPAEEAETGSQPEEADAETTAEVVPSAGRGLSLPAAAYGGVLVLLLLVCWVAYTTLGQLDHGQPDMPVDETGFMAGWVQWDSGWYYLLAEDGYGGPRVGDRGAAFFPGYPLAMRAGEAVVGNPLLAGMVVTIASGLGSALLFWRWCRDRMVPTEAVVSLLVLLLYPYAYYLYGAVYSDALFLCATLAAFVALERDRPFVAGVAGAVATLARPVGLAVVLGLVLRAMERRGALTRPRWLRLPTRIDAGALRLKDFGVLVSAVGMVVYSAFLWRRFDDPFWYANAQEYWGHSFGLKSLIKWDFFAMLRGIRGNYDDIQTWSHIGQAGVAVAAVAAIPLVIRRFGWGYGVYTLAVIGIPLVGRSDFYVMGRYALAAFPAFAVAGTLLTSLQPRLRNATLIASTSALVALTAAYAHGIYLT
jgi:hypothetical protein